MFEITSLFENKLILIKKIIGNSTARQHILLLSKCNVFIELGLMN